MIRKEKVYRVTTPVGVEIVRAYTQAQAINHVVGAKYKAETMSATELLDAVSSGANILDARASVEEVVTTVSIDEAVGASEEVAMPDENIEDIVDRQLSHPDLNEENDQA